MTLHAFKPGETEITLKPCENCYLPTHKSVIIREIFLQRELIIVNEDQKHDREFMDTFMLILGFLVAFTFCIFILANVISAKTQAVTLKDNPQAQELKKQRLAAVAEVKVASVANPDQPVEVVAAAPINGQTVYESACLACHAAGIAGAPKLGDATEWTARIAQGTDILYEHAIKGYQGESGIMPAKGGRSDLSDDEVIAAVDYMAENSQ